METPNTNYIDELSGENNDFKNKLIEILKKELPEEINLYKIQIKKPLLEAAASSVHKLKHKISILGLEKSYYIAENFESNLKNNSTDLQDDFENILKTMQIFVDKL